MSEPISKSRRIMRALKILEISGVDAPAQKGATVAIMKRDDGPPTVEQLLDELTKGHIDLVLDALAQAKGRPFTKADLGDALDKLASNYAANNQMSFAATYAEVLTTPLGGSMYAAFKRAPHDVAPLVRAPPYGSKEKAPLTPAGRQAVADALEAVAKEKAKLSGRTPAQEYAALLDTEAGKKAYAAYRGRAA